MLEKLSPALEHVDSSSGAMGSAVNRVITTLVPLIAQADVEPSLRQRWLDRLFEALQEDRMPYIESLGDNWGELCSTPTIASSWADRLLPLTAHVLGPDGQGAHFVGTTACLSALYAARRYDELIALVDSARLTIWWYRRWAIDALVALGRTAEALRYAEASRRPNAPEGAIAQACEAILLASGMKDEAYRRYAIAANRNTTNLATFRGIAKKYPERTPASIIVDLVASEPGSEGKWFAAAKDAGLFDLAISLARNSPTDPRTLTRAARDFAQKRPDFAMACALTALHWISAGYGYEITGIDVLNAYAALTEAATAGGMSPDEVNGRVREQISDDRSFVSRVLAQQLSG